MTNIESPLLIESFPCTETADIQVHVANGEVLVELVDIDVVTVAVYHGATESRSFTESRGLGEWLGLVREPGPDAVSDAVRSVTTHFTRGHLVVTAPNRRLTPVPLRILVRARPGSKIHLTGNTARFAVSGRARSLTAQWNSGDLTADDVDGRCKLRAGNGRIRLGASKGELNVRIGTSDVNVQRIAGSGARLTTGSGMVSFGVVEADVLLTTGAGTITVADAAAGHLHVRTGPGSIYVGVRSGVTATIDLSSRSGLTRSDLPVSAVRSPTAGASRSEVPLRITATTSHGDIIVAPTA